jgi:hypothetical protein
MFAVAENRKAEIKAVDVLWKLSSLSGVIASDLGPSLTALPQDIFLDRDGAAQAH